MAQHQAPEPSFPRAERLDRFWNCLERINAAPGLMGCPVRTTDTRYLRLQKPFFKRVSLNFSKKRRNKAALEERVA